MADVSGCAQTFTHLGVRVIHLQCFILNFENSDTDNSVSELMVVSD